MKKKSLIDVPVALFFFARPELLKVTFLKIRQLRPSILFLIQDGPRQNKPNDATKINDCRAIVDCIDWECKVFKNYSDLNLGCGLRVKSGISWAFENVDRLIIIEDDCVPGDSFFEFCQEMLERFKYDQRISMISGMNHVGIYEHTPYDYFFSEGGTIWGWATWKRVWDNIDYEMSWLNDPDAVRLISNKYGSDYVKTGLNKKKIIDEGGILTSWSYQHGINMLLHDGLIIIPKFNLVTNIGIGENGNHSASSINLVPRGLRRVYYMKTYTLNKPYKHPKYVVNDIEYHLMVNRIMAVDNQFIRIYRMIEIKIYNFFYKCTLKFNI